MSGWGAGLLLTLMLAEPATAAGTTSVQTATASGACSAAINAGVGAHVISTINCTALDTKTKAAVAKLIAQGRLSERVDRHQSQDIARLQAQLEEEHREREKLTQTVALLLARSEAPAANPEDSRIAALVQQGDAVGAAALIQARADRTLQAGQQQQREASKLYLQQADLLGTRDAKLALAAAEKAVAADPTNISALSDAAYRAIGANEKERALDYAQREHDAARALMRAAPDDILGHDSFYESAFFIAIGRLEKGDEAGALASLRDAATTLARAAEMDPFNSTLGELAENAATSFGRILQTGSLFLAAPRPYDRTIQAWRDAVRTAQTQAQAAPADEARQRALLDAYDTLALALQVTGDEAGAASLRHDALPVVEALAQRRPDAIEWQARLWWDNFLQGSEALRRGSAAEARAAFAKALALADRLARADPARKAWQRNLAYSHDYAAQAAEADQDKAGAIREYAAEEVALQGLIAGGDDQSEKLSAVRAALARLRGQ